MQTAPAGPHEAARVLSAEEALFLAKTRVEKGELDEAEKLYAALQANPNEDVRIEAAFQVAQIRVRQGRYRQGISLFHEILNQRPDLVRVRLELARAYFLDKNYEDATFQFELVKGGDLPPDVLANVDAFLNTIRRQKNWTVNFSLAPMSDSNINEASEGREECIDTAFGTLCRPLPEKSGGIGLSASAAADYFWRFNENWGLKATVGFSGTAYKENEYNDYTLYAALGPRYLWDSGEASVQPAVRKRWIANDQYSDEYGLRLDGRQIFGRLLLDAGAAYFVSRYADTYVNSLLRGSSWNVYGQPRYILTDRTFIQAGLEFLREKTKVRAYANDSWRYSVGAYHAFPFGLSLFLEGSLMPTRYKDSQWYVTRGNRIAEAVRKDLTQRLSASLSSNIFERYGLTPVLQYTYTNRHSNIWTREYDRHRLNLLLNYSY
jgi:hypothetical protein